MKRTDHAAATADWLASFAATLKRGDAAGAAALFAADGYWRDLVSFTWNIVTLEGRSAIADMLAARLSEVRPDSFRTGDRDGWFSFETALGQGTGHVRLKDGEALTLFTALMELKGFEEKAGETRELGVEHGAIRNRVTWTDRRQSNAAEFGYTRQPFVLVIGGGQGGIGLGARLKRLGVPALIVDRNARPGDAWRNRYKSLCLHDPVWYDHLPYLPFPDHWPIYTPKDKMGDWLESYVKIMELDYWSSTACRNASWDADRREWTVTVEREGTPVSLKPKHIVLATGMSGFPEIPRGLYALWRAAGRLAADGRPHQAGGRGLLRSPARRGLPAHLRRGRDRHRSDVSPPRLGLLHRRRRLRPDRRRQDQAQVGRRDFPPHRGFGRAGRRQRAEG